MATKASISIPATQEDKLAALTNISDAVTKLADLFKDQDLMKNVREIGAAASEAYTLTQEEKAERDEAVSFIAKAAITKKELEELSARIEQTKTDTLTEIQTKQNESLVLVENRIAAVSAREEAVTKREQDATQIVSEAEQKVVESNTAHEKRMAELDEKERKLKDDREAVESQKKLNEEKEKSLKEWEDSLTVKYNKISGVLNELKV